MRPSPTYRQATILRIEAMAFQSIASLTAPNDATMAPYDDEIIAKIRSIVAHTDENIRILSATPKDPLGAHLVVVHPFRAKFGIYFNIGDVICDPATMAETLAGPNAKDVVRVTATRSVRGDNCGNNAE